MTEKTETLQLRVVFFQEGSRWVAQGVDYDITASGESIPRAQFEFFWAFIGEVLVRAERGDRNPLKSLPKTPRTPTRHCDE